MVAAGAIIGMRVCATMLVSGTLCWAVVVPILQTKGVDPHHHLWDLPGYRYLFPELLADVGSGHNIQATLFEQAGSMYRADGPEELRSLGETEFVCGVAAMSASGKYGPTRCVAGVVGYVDLRLGSRAKGVLERHIAVSDGRVRGIRNSSAWSDDPILGRFGGAAGPGLYLDKSFREGFAALAGQFPGR
jgi:L-fuconolactonase